VNRVSTRSSSVFKLSDFSSLFRTERSEVACRRQPEGAARRRRAISIFGFRIFGVSLAAFTVLCTTRALAAPPEVRVLDDPARIEVSSALPPAGVEDEKFLSIALIDDSTGRPGAPIFGAWSRDQSRLVFRPRFALAPGARYRISAGNERLDHQVPALTVAAPATVTSISPAAAELPANLLKFYLHFSRPMREGREVFEHIHLLDESGQPVPAPWRDTELWTEDARRLTLWIHPGRVKRGVNLREEFGPVLRPGASYTLVVDRGLRDVTGQPVAEFRHRFRTAAERNALLDTADWSLDAPAAGTRNPLRVVAATALDAVITRRALHVQDAAGREAEGAAALSDDGRTWTFTPRHPWPAAAHTLLADSWLEDLAGNTFERIFDNDTTAPTSAAPPQTRRKFTPR
jgi:hypothetical protein